MDDTDIETGREINSWMEMVNNAIMPVNADTGGLHDYVDQIMIYASILAGIFMVLFVGVKVATYFANPSKDLDPYVLVRPILIVCTLLLYKPLVKHLLMEPTYLVEDISEAVARRVTGTTSKDSFEGVFMRNMAYMSWTQADEGEDSGEGEQEYGVGDFLAMSTGFEFIHLLIVIIARFVAFYLMIKQVILKGIYYVLGVLVLPFSLVPGNEEILKKWFFGFLAVLLWIPVLRIMQTMMILMRKGVGEGLVEGTSAGGNVWGMGGFLELILQISMIFFIIQVPKYANLMVGGSGEASDAGTLTTIMREMYYMRLNLGPQQRGGH